MAAMGHHTHPIFINNKTKTTNSITHKFQWLYCLTYDK